MPRNISSIAKFGKCIVNCDGNTDGCQQFEPSALSAHICNNCGHKKGFHEVLISKEEALITGKRVAEEGELRRKNY
jgi:hypothetical protein